MNSSPKTSLPKVPHVLDFPHLAQTHAHGFGLLEHLVIPTFVLDAQSRVIVWNGACERLTGVPAYEILGTHEAWRCFYQNPRPTLADLVVQERVYEMASLYETHGRPSDEPGSLSAESWCDMPRIGRRRYLAVDASPIHDPNGHLLAVVETLRDMTEEKQAQISLEQLATRDGLTGLANRRCFDDTLHAEWQRALRQKQPLSLLMVDVDNFKQYNDAYGHVGGDECLQRIAGAVAKEMRANDLVARYGGEEFAVILPNQALKGAAIVAERIRCRVEALHLPNLGAAKQFVTVSIGAATALAAPETDPSQLLATADAALYRAKHMGRNRISLPREG
ncbi:PAS domain S-box-containing protein/diguanylate cyclase (GGDEF)-like protein [Pseudoduganella lurida]|uniref:diguanylate cyclase n=1 Tax=Pseudoduganella lurida TaxID=1036180 RepID=A0A562RL70_9BURK|nr:diguanylate cyclase [Pseudoduganella lurida]TWI69186.1 PAS domain S-box-containing protein/diguanylate cyclase (GGDEF)-like protein [Pseudoduganella lurida]